MPDPLDLEADRFLGPADPLDAEADRFLSAPPVRERAIAEYRRRQGADAWPEELAQFDRPGRAEAYLRETKADDAARSRDLAPKPAPEASFPEKVAGVLREVPAAASDFASEVIAEARALPALAVGGDYQGERARHKEEARSKGNVVDLAERLAAEGSARLTGHDPEQVAAFVRDEVARVRDATAATLPGRLAQGAARATGELATMAPALKAIGLVPTMAGTGAMHAEPGQEGVGAVRGAATALLGPLLSRWSAPGAEGFRRSLAEGLGWTTAATAVDPANATPESVISNFVIGVGQDFVARRPNATRQEVEAAVTAEVRRRFPELPEGARILGLPEGVREGAPVEGTFKPYARELPEGDPMVSVKETIREAEAGHAAERASFRAEGEAARRTVGEPSEALRKEARAVLDLTPEEAGEVKARAVQEGAASPEEVFSPERLEVVRAAEEAGVSPEMTLRLLEAENAVRRPDGNVAEGFRATADVLADPQIPEVQKDAIRAANAKGIATASSHVDPEGRGVAIGRDQQGRIRRVEAAARKPGRTLSQFVRAEGGINAGESLRGEVERLGKKGSGTTGLLRRIGGKSPEDMMQAAREAGYEVPQTPAEFLDRVEMDATKREVHRSAQSHDFEAEAERADRARAADLGRWFEEMGRSATIPSRGTAPIQKARTPAEAGTALPPEPKAPGKKPKRLTGEEGALRLPSGAELKAAGEEVARQVRRLFGTEPQRVRDLQGKAPGVAAAMMGRAIDRAKALLGDLSPALTEALKATGGVGLDKFKAARAATRPIVPRLGSRVRYYPFIEWIEGRAQPSGPAETNIRDRLSDLIFKRGEVFESVGLKQERAGNIGPFVNRRGVAPRQYDAEWNDWLVKERLNSPDWKHVTEAWAEATGLSVADADTFLREMRDDVTRTGIPSENRETQAETARTLKRVPHAIQLPGRLLHVLTPNPHRYAKGLAERGAARAGVVAEMGQDIGKPGQPGYQNPVAALGEQVRKETGDEGRFTRAMQAVHGATPGKPLVSPGSRAAPIIRGLNAVLSTAKNLAQTLSSLPNAMENLAGSVRGKVGTAPFLRGIARLAKDPKGVVAALELQGKITRDILDISPEPGRPAASFVKALNGIISRTPLHGRWVNELNEKVAASAFETFAHDDMAGGKNFGRSVVLLRSLGYGPAYASRLASGKGTRVEYDRVVRELTSRSTGSNLGKAETSFLETTRWFPPLQWFARYAMMRARSAANSARGYVKSMEQAFTDATLTPKQKWSVAVEAQRRLVSGGLSTAAVGVGTKMLAALVTGGTLGFKQAWKDVEEDVVGAAFDGLVYQMVAGPFSLVARMITDSRPVEAKDVLAPVSVGQNIYDFLAGHGQYENLPPGEKWRMFLARTVPGVKGYDSILTAFGLGKPEDNEIRTALSAFWKWRRQNAPFPTGGKGGHKSDDREAWLTAMKGAYLAATRGETPEQVYGHIALALGVPGKDEGAVRQSLRARKVLDLRDIPEHERAAALAKMRNDLHPDVLKLLEAHDALLDRLASSGREERKPKETRPGRPSKAAPLTPERVEKALGR